MLDEILEYQQYTFDINNPDSYVQRLKRSTLICFNQDKTDKTKRYISLTGLNRVLTVIARHFLYDVYDDEEDIKNKTINALKSWLGHKMPDGSASAEAQTLYRWLPLYVERILLSKSIDKLTGFINNSGLQEKDRNELNAVICQLSGQCSQKEKVYLAGQLLSMCEQLHFIPGNDRTDRSVFNCSEFLYQLSNKRSFNTSGYEDFGEANTVNAITYDRILGNARRTGCLKRYYLACDCSHIGDVKLESGRKIRDTDRDIILKLTACCLMKLTKKGTRSEWENKTVSITEADFINWIIKEKCDKAKQQSFLYKGKRLFGEPVKNNDYKNKGLNTKWIKLNQQWLSDSGFEIMTDDPDTDVIHAFLEKHPDGSVFIDKGTGVPMMEVKNK